MRGIIFYSRDDYEKNKVFVDWLIDEFNAKRHELELIFVEDFYKARMLSFRPDFIINRSRDYNLSQLFELNGIRVFNNSQITLLGNNKYSGYLFAKNNGFEVAEIPINIYHNGVIVKPIYGHGGQDIELKTCLTFDKNFIYQEYVKDLDGDVRFYVIGKEIVKVVRRYRDDGEILLNFSQNGKVEIFSPDSYMLSEAKRFISLLDIDYAGDDFFITKSGKFIFTELEDVVGSRMLSFLGCNNMVPLFVEHIIKESERRA